MIVGSRSWLDHQIGLVSFVNTSHTEIPYTVHSEILAPVRSASTKPAYSKFAFFKSALSMLPILNMFGKGALEVCTAQIAPPKVANSLARSAPTMLRWRDPPVKIVSAKLSWRTIAPISSCIAEVTRCRTHFLKLSPIRFGTVESPRSERPGLFSHSFQFDNVGTICVFRIRQLLQLDQRANLQNVQMALLRHQVDDPAPRPTCCPADDDRDAFQFRGRGFRLRFPLGTTDSVSRLLQLPGLTRFNRSTIPAIKTSLFTRLSCFHAWTNS